MTLYKIVQHALQINCANELLLQEDIDIVIKRIDINRPELPKLKSPILDMNRIEASWNVLILKNLGILFSLILSFKFHIYTEN